MKGEGLAARLVAATKPKFSVYSVLGGLQTRSSRRPCGLRVEALGTEGTERPYKQGYEEVRHRVRPCGASGEYFAALRQAVSGSCGSIRWRKL